MLSKINDIITLRGSVNSFIRQSKDPYHGRGFWCHHAKIWTALCACYVSIFIASLLLIHKKDAMSATFQVTPSYCHNVLNVFLVNVNLRTIIQNLNHCIRLLYGLVFSGKQAALLLGEKGNQRELEPKTATAAEP